MSCPTCDGTMQSLVSEPSPIWWCDRCGTLKTLTADPAFPARPMLVSRVRRLHTGFAVRSPERARMMQLGITEAIYRPEEREP